jgi:hypothetical protein
MHAQVAIIADKYYCASLFKLATRNFANSIKSNVGDDWAAVAGLVYDYTTAEGPGHNILRSQVVAAVTSSRSVSKLFLDVKSVQALLRSNADLTTDLLLSGVSLGKEKDTLQRIFTCSHCHFAHFGIPTCRFLKKAMVLTRRCPQCQGSGYSPSKQYGPIVKVSCITACSECQGYHTSLPEPDILSPESEGVTW